MDLVPLIAPTYHEMAGNLNLRVVYLCVAPAQPPGDGVPGYPLREMCLPQGPDLGFVFAPVSQGVLGGATRASLPCEGAPYVGNGVRRLPDQPPSGKGDSMPGIACGEMGGGGTQHCNRWLEKLTE